MALEKEQEILHVPNEHKLYGREEMLERMLFKSQLIKEGRLDEAAKIKIIVYFDGGGQAVATEVGWGRKLFELGSFHDGTIDIVIGASGGSVVATHSVIGDVGATKIFEENCKNKFVGVGNMRKYGRLVDFEGFGDTLRQFPLDKEELQKVKSQVYVVTTDTETGQRKFFDMKKVEDPEAILHASCLIPFVGNKKHVAIEGRAHNDGALGGMPTDIFDEFSYTDSLAICCFPQEETSLQKRINDMWELVSRPLPPIYRAALASGVNGRRARQEMYMRHWREDPDDPVFHLMVAPAKAQVGTYAMDFKALTYAMEDSYASATHHFIVAAKNLAEKLEPDTIPAKIISD